MKYSKKIFLSLFWIVLGAILTAMYFLGKLPEFYNSFGFALVIVGILQLIRHIRYAKNKEYREKVDTLQNDERNKFISSFSASVSSNGFSGLIVGKLVSFNLYSLPSSIIVPFS